MRRILVLALLIPLLMPACAVAQEGGNAGSDQDSTKFAGVWRGRFDNLPGVDLVITNEGGEVHGAVLFYLHKRPDVNSPYTSTPGLPEPMLNLSRDGDTLKFQVSHRRAHPPGSLHDAPKEFYLKLTGPDHAELANESGGAPGLAMTRSDY